MEREIHFYSSQSICRSLYDQFTVAQVKAGEYIAVKTGTPRTDNGTAANTATLSGTVAFFVDYVPTYNSDGKWNS